MDYAIYFEADGEVYRLPTNPEDIKCSKELNTEQYRMLTGNQVVLPIGRALEEISFEAEFPYDERRYTNKSFKNADSWEKTFKQWQENRKVVRFITSNGLGDEISMEVLITQTEHLEKAGEEGDKYISLKLLEYIAPSKRYVAVSGSMGRVRKNYNNVSNPAVTSGKTHTVVKGDTLWGIAKKYYGSGNQYIKIYQVNSDKISNPNLIYPGQVLTIPV